MTKSTITTANEPASGLDPGGTKPAPPKKGDATQIEQKVKSGDRNEKPSKPGNQPR